MKMLLEIDNNPQNTHVSAYIYIEHSKHKAMIHDKDLKIICYSVRFASKEIKKEILHVYHYQSIYILFHHKEFYRDNI